VNWQMIAKAAMKHASVITIAAAVILKSRRRDDTQLKTMRPTSPFHPASRVGEPLG
jgi:hypothetical protein